MPRPPDLFESVNLRRKRLHEQIADSIQDLIAGDQLQAGTQLPPEGELASRLGVSRGTLREAVRILEQRGLVTMKPGTGTYVTEVAPAAVADSIERYFSLSSASSYGELVQVREIMEPEVAALAALNGTSEDLLRMGAFVDELESAFTQGDTQRCAAADAGFHIALAIASHNELITAITSGLHRIMRSWMEATQPSEAGTTSHRGVYEAVVSHDPDAAREAMDEHLRNTRRSLLG